MKCRRVTPEDYFARHKHTLSDPKKVCKEQLLYQVYSQYELLLKKRKCIDFSDMLLRAYDLLKNNEVDLSEYRHVVIDEFHSLQFQIATELARKNETPSIFVVGDRNQGIYGFRGAEPCENFDIFERTFNQMEQISLDLNYRSHDSILRCSTEVINGGSMSNSPTLHSCNGAKGPPVHVS
ncbi:MAG: hypothetical protein MHM6MM_002161 [Cercozoa sp. M6MM]